MTSNKVTVTVCNVHMHHSCINNMGTNVTFDFTMLAQYINS